MASDLIKKADVQKILKALYENRQYSDISIALLSAMEDIHDLPTVDAVEVVHGEWEVCGEDLNGEVTYKCSNCGDELVTLCGFEIDWNYCPNCGADMRVGRWKGEGMGDYSCSLCGEVVNGNHREECPNCHAKMDGGEKE